MPSSRDVATGACTSPPVRSHTRIEVRTVPVAMRMLRRNWSAGELRVLLLSLLIAGGSGTTRRFFADRGQAALDQQANELLGAGLVVIADHRIPAQFAEAAARAGLDTATTMTFPSMVSAAGNVSLAEIKAASDGFPLRGRIKVTERPGAPEREVEGGPRPGTVWIGAALVGRSGVKVGDTLQVGRAKLAIAQIITREPDSVLDYFGLAPRVLMHASDVEATGLIQTGSRLGYRLLVRGEPKAVQRF